MTEKIKILIEDIFILEKEKSALKKFCYGKKNGKQKNKNKK